MLLFPPAVFNWHVFFLRSFLFPYFDHNGRRNTLPEAQTQLLGIEHFHGPTCYSATCPNSLPTAHIRCPAPHSCYSATCSNAYSGDVVRLQDPAPGILKHEEYEMQAFWAFVASGNTIKPSTREELDGIYFVTPVKPRVVTTPSVNSTAFVVTKKKREDPRFLSPTSCRRPKIRQGSRKKVTSVVGTAEEDDNSLWAEFMYLASEF